MKENESSKISRRRFGKTAMMASVAAMIPSTVSAHVHPKPASPQKDKAEEKLPAEARQEIEAKYQNILRKYGDRLSEEQRKRMRQILAYNQKMLIPVRAFSLENWNAPATILKLSEPATRPARRGRKPLLGTEGAH